MSNMDCPRRIDVVNNPRITKVIHAMKSLRKLPAIRPKYSQQTRNPYFRPMAWGPLALEAKSHEKTLRSCSYARIVRFTVIVTKLGCR
jgi:hypothetical protein